MSYDATSLRLMGGVPGQQLFLYRTTDAISAVTTAGYFNAAIAEYNLSSGDMILTVTSTGTTPIFDGLVANLSGSTVSVGLLS